MRRGRIQFEACPRTSDCVIRSELPKARFRLRITVAQITQLRPRNSTARRKAPSCPTIGETPIGGPSLWGSESCCTPDECGSRRFSGFSYPIHRQRSCSGALHIPKTDSPQLTSSASWRSLSFLLRTSRRWQEFLQIGSRTSRAFGGEPTFVPGLRSRPRTSKVTSLSVVSGGEC